MAWSSESILLAISAVCQFYYVSYSTTSLYLAINVTLPEYCQDGSSLLTFMTFLLWYIFANMMGNFVCIIYKSKLSIVSQPSHLKRGDDYLGMESKYSGSGTSSILHSSSQYHKDEVSVWQNRDGHLLDATKNTMLEEDHKGAFITNNNQPSAEDCRLSEHNDAETLGGWSQCKDCMVLTPPRGKHCPLCKHCVLKRDHHCYFVGKCIGFHNQRFFICFCFYGSMGGFLSLWLASHYLRVHYGMLESWGRFAYVGPFAFLSWLFGYTSGSVCWMVMFLWWSFFTSLMGFVYGVGQIALVIRGQTKWEFYKDIFPYRGTLLANVHSVFGKLWPIGFFIPAPFLGYVGDGANWDYLLDNGWKRH